MRAALVTESFHPGRAAELGVRADLWTPGVDTAAFTPRLRDPWLHHSWSRARSRSGPLVFVGHLCGLGRRQDVRRLAELASVPGIRPVVLGDGPHRGWLEGRLTGAELAAGRSWSIAVDELVAARYAPLVGSRVTTTA
jgi:phosphatidylinositol alpha 1,6-mannosyltransferase